MRRCRASWLRAAALLPVAALLACAPSAADAPLAEQWRRIEVAVAPVEFGAARVGRLAYRGGLELRSESPAFGGLSGMQVLDGDRLIAISDDGSWFEARLMLSEAGELVGARDWRTALMRNENGEPFANKRAGDSEDLAVLPDGRFAVVFEQTQTIRIYELNRDGPFGAAASGPRLAETDSLPNNAGLEAIASDGAETLIVGAEGGDRATTPVWRAALGAPAPAPPSARYPLARGFSLTSLDRLPDGGFVALERFFVPVIGPRARIKRFAFGSDGAISGVEDWALLAPPMPIDNFEAIAAVRMADGATRIYVLSDDNFSRRQRTLLLAFDVLEAE